MKTKALISCAVTAKLIWAFVFTYAKHFLMTGPILENQNMELFCPNIFSVFILRELSASSNWWDGSQQIDMDINAYGFLEDGQPSVPIL